MSEDYDFQSLLAEAHELGIQYTGDDAAELNAIITMARAEAGRDHPVPCYGQSFDPTDRRCRICQLRDPCADLDKRPRIEVVEAKLRAIPCEACGRGMLQVECEDNHGHLRDFACTTKGCQNSVAVQCGWESTGAKVVREIVLGEPEVKPEPEAKLEPPAESEPPKPKPKAKAKAKPKPQPKLRVVEGGSLSKATKRKVVVTKTTKKAKASPSKKPAVKRVAVRKPVGKVGANGAMVFLYQGATYKSLTAAVNAATASRNWSPAKFFKGHDTKTITVGDVFERDWNGRTIRVEVISE